MVQQYSQCEGKDVLACSQSNLMALEPYLNVSTVVEMFALS